MSTVALKQTASHSYRLTLALAGLVGVGAAAYIYSNNDNSNTPNSKPVLAGAAAAQLASVPQGKTFKDYQRVYNDIAIKARDEDDADQGAGRSGLLVRLAWHALGTYLRATGKGGSYGGGMIFPPEQSDPGNAGLETGRDFLAEFLVKYPWISRGDLWTLGGVVGVQEAGGPKIKWRPGRENVTDAREVPENGFLPDATQGGDHVRDVFVKRMGFTDRETVALVGAHCLGRCHTWRLGFDGPWGPSPNMFTNDFFVRLLQKWHVRKWDGPKQYEDDETNLFMMLPTDMAMKEDSGFYKWTKKYADDERLFFTDFSAAFTKLLENGIQFDKKQPYWEFETLDDQDNE